MSQKKQVIKRFQDFAKRSSRIIKTYHPDRQPLITEREEDVNLHCTIMLVMIGRSEGIADLDLLKGLVDEANTQLAIDLIDRADREGLR